LYFFEHGAAKDGQADNQNNGHQYGTHKITLLGWGDKFEKQITKTRNLKNTKL